MSKNSKRKSADFRKKQKQARKAANTSRFQAMRDAGQNQKSKRVKLKNKRKKTIRAIKHVGQCFNVGCVSCSPTGKLVHEKRALKRSP